MILIFQSYFVNSLVKVGIENDRIFSVTLSIKPAFTRDTHGNKDCNRLYSRTLVCTVKKITSEAEMVAVSDKTFLSTVMQEPERQICILKPSLAAHTVEKCSRKSCCLVVQGCSKIIFRYNVLYNKDLVSLTEIMCYLTGFLFRIRAGR